MASKLVDDPRIDPRIKAVMGGFPTINQGDVASREQALAEANTDEAIAAREGMKAFMDMVDNDQVAPSAGLAIDVHEFTSSPDGNTIQVRLIRPQSTAALPCVYYIHGGGMASMSCFDGMYRAWGKIIAAQGVAVAMVDFRNCLTPSSAADVVPFPGGLNDCVSGLKWLHSPSRGSRHRRGSTSSSPARAAAVTSPWRPGLKLKQDGDLGLIRGLYALCPYIAGQWPQERFPSSVENNGILLDLHNNRGAMAYGIDALTARSAGVAVVRQRGRRARPGADGDQRQRGDPLRDEGIEFYRLLLRAGVPARCRQVMGTIHGTEIFTVACPDISRETAASIAQFCREA
jgi:acetyl esterase